MSKIFDGTINASKAVQQCVHLINIRKTMKHGKMQTCIEEYSHNMFVCLLYFFCNYMFPRIIRTATVRRKSLHFSGSFISNFLFKVKIMSVCVCIFMCECVCVYCEASSGNGFGWGGNKGLERQKKF